MADWWMTKLAELLVLNVDGIDGTIIGPYDLSGSMGKPGRYDDNDVREVLKTYEKISKDNPNFIWY